MEKFIDKNNLEKNLKEYHESMVSPLHDSLITIEGDKTVEGSILQKIYNNAADAVVTYTEDRETKTATIKDYIKKVADESGKIASIKVNGTEQTITDKTVTITIPTKTSELTNNSNYVSDSTYVHTDNNFTSDLKNMVETGCPIGTVLQLEESIDPNTLYPGTIWIKLS